MPKVSVLIAVYNPPVTHLHETLKSVFNQTFRDFEVIIIDDGSSINTQEILDPFRNRIRYFYKENGGVNTARLCGLGKAQGLYIALIDQDDIWVPHKLQKQVEFLDAYPELDLIFGDFHNFDEHGFFPTSFFDSNKIFRKIPSEIASNISCNGRIFKDSILYDFLRGNFILQCTLMARKEICEKYEMFITKTNGREFFEFGLRTIHLLKIGFIDEILAHRRIHSNNVTHNYELFNQNTAIICEGALNYPWMDSECKSFLKNVLQRVYLNLGKYYIVQGRFPEARNNLNRLLRMGKFRSKAVILYCLAFIGSPELIRAARVVRNAFRFTSENVGSRRSTA